MKRLKICMICSEFPPGGAGIAQSVYNLSIGLVKKGHQVTIITRGSVFSIKKEIIDGIIVYRAPFIMLPPPLHIKFHGLFVNKLLKKIDDFDIIHLHSPLVPFIKSNKPKILTVHSCWANESKTFDRITDLYSLYINIFKNAFIKTELKSMNNSNQIITISNDLINKIKRYYKMNIKIEIIGNGVDSFNFSPTKKKNNIINILFVGRLVYGKGVLDIIPAARYVCKKFSNCIFSIVGKGHLENRLRKEIINNKLEKNIFLLGSIPHFKLPKLINNSSIFILPSYSEGLPLSIIEAMACEKPVIGTNIGGIRELIEDGKNGLLVPIKNSKSLADAIIKILENPKLAKQMGENGRKLVEQKYTWEKVAKDVEKVYRSVLK